jgi:addiction module HigA family antidote
MLRLSTTAIITDKSNMARMHNPPHPGEVLRDGVFAGTGITVTEFARRLGVTRVALSRVLNGKAAISAQMAVRLAAALGGTPATWLELQASYDLWHAERALKRQVARIERIKPMAQRG